MATTVAVVPKAPSSTVLFLRNFARNKVGMVGLVIVLVIILAAIFASLISGYSPTSLNPAIGRQPPSGTHLLGTDQLGRDVFSRLLYGARVSIYIGVAASLAETVIGSALGALAGYIGGWLDTVLVRISEIIMTFPQLILIMAFVALIGPGANNLVLVFAVTGWMTTFRLVRGEFFSIREETYVEACRAFGFGRFRIIFKHMVPNTLSPIVVAFTINIAIYIITAAGLSYLGLGVPITTPTWGNLLASAQSPQVMKEYWWLWVFPALAISIFVAGVNFIGDGLRDVLDPRTRSK